jgi:hypothetical protein
VSVWDSEYCLNLFNRKAGRPVADAITTDSKYQRLAESQDAVIAELAAVNPESLVGAPQSLVTTDQQVFTFGTDGDGNPIVPFGKTGIYQSLSSIPQFPWREGIDYLDEGTQIRIPNNRTYSGTLYWRGVVQAPPISATTQPVLYPLASRELIVIDAVRKFASEYLRNKPLADQMELEWSGSAYRTGAWPKWTLVWATQFRAGGAMRLVTSANVIPPLSPFIV